MLGRTRIGMVVAALGAMGSLGHMPNMVNHPGVKNAQSASELRGNLDRIAKQEQRLRAAEVASRVRRTGRTTSAPNKLSQKGLRKRARQRRSHGF